jgi:hypothetical protein
MSLRAKINLSDQNAKRLLLDAIRAMSGEHRVEIVLYRPRRSDRQNKFYWPCFVEPFADWLSEQRGKQVDPQIAHEIFKQTFLRVCVGDADGVQLFDKAGEPLMRTRSTTELNTARFNEYLDQCAALLVELGALREMPEPSTYHEVAA